MRSSEIVLSAMLVCVVALLNLGACQGQQQAQLPEGVAAVWDLDKAYREATPTRERVCINGLWRWHVAFRVGGRSTKSGSKNYLATWWALHQLGSSYPTKETR